jgi:hypothetical protein
MTKSNQFRTKYKLFGRITPYTLRQHILKSAEKMPPLEKDIPSGGNPCIAVLINIV